MTDEEYRIRTEQRIDSLLQVIEEQNQQIAIMQPVFDYACRLAELWEPKKDVIPENNKELVRLWNKARG